MNKLIEALEFFGSVPLQIVSHPHLKICDIDEAQKQYKILKKGLEELIDLEDRVKELINFIIEKLKEKEEEINDEIRILIQILMILDKKGKYYE